MNDRTSRERELEYPCVAEQPDGTLDYWAIRDLKIARADVPRAYEMADLVFDLAARDQDGVTLGKIFDAALKAGHNRKHPGFITSNLFISALLSRAIYLKPAREVRRDNLESLG